MSARTHEELQDLINRVFTLRTTKGWGARQIAPAVKEPTGTVQHILNSLVKVNAVPPLTRKNIRRRIDEIITKEYSKV